MIESDSASRLSSVGCGGPLTPTPWPPPWLRGEAAWLGLGPNHASPRWLPPPGVAAVRAMISCEEAEKVP